MGQDLNPTPIFIQTDASPIKNKEIKGTANGMILIGEADKNIILNIIIAERKPIFYYSIYFVDVTVETEDNADITVIFTAMSLYSISTNTNYYGEYDFTIYYIEI